MPSSMEAACRTSKKVSGVCVYFAIHFTHSIFPPFCLSSWRHSHSFHFCLFLMCTTVRFTTSIYFSERYQADIKRGREKNRTYVAKNSSWKQLHMERTYMPKCACQYGNTTVRQEEGTRASFVYFICMFALHVQRKPHYSTTTLLVQFKVQLDRCARGDALVGKKNSIRRGPSLSLSSIHWSLTLAQCTLPFSEHKVMCR